MGMSYADSHDEVSLGRSDLIGMMDYLIHILHTYICIYIYINMYIYTSSSTLSTPNRNPNPNSNPNPDPHLDLELDLSNARCCRQIRTTLTLCSCVL